MYHSFPAWTEKGVLGKTAYKLGVLTPSLPTKLIMHAPMSQYIVPFSPYHSQGTYRPFGNIILFII
jgi:hypothetical protein